MRDKHQVARQSDRPRLSASQATARAFAPDEKDLAFRQTLERQRELLRSLAPPTTVITLDHPDTIELSNNAFPVVLFEPVIGPFQSAARLIVDQGSNPHSNSPVVTATYKWKNPSNQNFALINVGTLLRIRGTWEIDSNSGTYFFFGSRNTLDIHADLTIEINDGAIFVGGNTHQNLVNEVLTGDPIFFDQITKNGSVFQAVGLDVDSIPIPPDANVSFVVDLTVACELDPDATLGDRVRADFGTFTNLALNRVQFPFLHVEVLTG
jgi:hypothetical protein